MNKQIELYAYIHRLDAGILTITPKDNFLNRVMVPVSHVEFEVSTQDPRKVLLRMDEETAIYYGFRAGTFIDTSAGQVGLMPMKTTPVEQTPEFKEAVLKEATRIAQIYIEQAKAERETAKVDRHATHYQMGADKMAAKLAPAGYVDESHDLAAIREAEGTVDSDYLLHDDRSVLDRLPKAVRPVSDMLKGVAKNFK